MTPIDTIGAYTIMPHTDEWGLRYEVLGPNTIQGYWGTVEDARDFINSLIEAKPYDDMLRQISVEALDSVNQQWESYLTINGYDASEDENIPYEAYDDMELYLYVYVDGDWIIDHAQYLSCHRGLFAQASLGSYATADELYRELLNDANWDVIDDRDMGE